MVNCAFTILAMICAIALFLSAAAPGAVWTLDTSAQPLESRPVVRASATILRSATASPVTGPGDVHRQVRLATGGRARVEFE